MRSYSRPWTGGPQSPRQLSRDWAEIAGSLGIEPISFHALRHTHASMLIDQGVDIVKVSKRLGHASPTITLQIYAHLFRQRDDISAGAINAALASVTPIVTNCPARSLFVAAAAEAKYLISLKRMGGRAV